MAKESEQKSTEEPKELKVFLGAYLKKTVVDRLDELAAKQNRNRSNMLEVILENTLFEDKEEPIEEPNP